jgi:tellurite resistance protein TerC
VPAGYQHKVLFWGVVGALAFRFVFIFAGAQLLTRLSWTSFVLGGFLVWTGYRLAVRGQPDIDPSPISSSGLVRKLVPTVLAYHGNRFCRPRTAGARPPCSGSRWVAIEATDRCWRSTRWRRSWRSTTDTFIV